MNIFIVVEFVNSELLTNVSNFNCKVDSNDFDRL